MRQFTIKQLLFATVVLAVVVALAAPAVRHSGSAAQALHCWLLSGAVAGTTLGWLYSRRTAGAIVGAMLGLIIQFITYFTILGYHFPAEAPWIC